MDCNPQADGHVNMTACRLQLSRKKLPMRLMSPHGSALGRLAKRRVEPAA